MRKQFIGSYQPTDVSYYLDSLTNNQLRINFVGNDFISQREKLIHFAHLKDSDSDTRLEIGFSVNNLTVYLNVREIRRFGKDTNRCEIIVNCRNKFEKQHVIGMFREKKVISAIN